MRFNKKFLLFVLLLVVYITSGMWGKGLLNKQVAKEEGGPISVNVYTKVLKKQLRKSVLRLPGMVEASAKIDVKSRVSGMVRRINCTVGEYVKKGAFLMLVDSENKDLALNVAKNNLDLAKIEYDSNRALIKKSFTSPLSLRASQAKFSEAKNQYDQAMRNLEYCKAIAPTDGFVSHISASENCLINNNEDAITLLVLDPAKVVVWLSDEEANLVRVKDRVRLVMHNGKVLFGDVGNITPAADNNIRCFKVNIVVKNKEHLLVEGTSCMVEFETQPRNLTFVPISALAANSVGDLEIKVLSGMDEVDSTIFREVKVKQVRIVDVDKNGLWTDSLDGEELAVVIGQDFLKKGKGLLIKTKDIYTLQEENGMEEEGFLPEAEGINWANGVEDKRGVVEKKLIRSNETRLKKQLDRGETRGAAVKK